MAIAKSVGSKSSAQDSYAHSACAAFTWAATVTQMACGRRSIFKTIVRSWKHPPATILSCFTLLSNRQGRGNGTLSCAACMRFTSSTCLLLTLCGVCQEPLWGIRMQAFLCMSCRLPVHRGCIRSLSMPGCRRQHHHHTVNWAALRTSFIEHFRPMLFSERDLDSKGYEEVSDRVLRPAHSATDSRLGLPKLRAQYRGTCAWRRARGPKRFRAPFYCPLVSSASHVTAIRYVATDQGCVFSLARSSRIT